MSSQSLEKGLYVVATPIGNLQDMVPRAIDVLQSVDRIAAEDTRHSKKLLDNFDIRTPMVSFHDFSEGTRCDDLIQQLLKGDSIALISDAGTPLVSDPGYQLVRSAHEHAIPVFVVPGACAAIAALSVAGLPSDRFVFEGFLPATRSARRKRLSELVSESRTLVFYESPHRIEECVQDAVEAFGEDRECCLARELTKLYETLYWTTLKGLLETVPESVMKGEMVLVIRGHSQEKSTDMDVESERILKLLMSELPLKQAASLAAQITGVRKKTLYDAGVRLKDEVLREGKT